MDFFFESDDDSDVQRMTNVDDEGLDRDGLPIDDHHLLPIDDNLLLPIDDHHLLASNTDCHTTETTVEKVSISCNNTQLN